MIPVVWLNYHPEICNSPGMWDQGWLQETLNCTLYMPQRAYDFTQYSVVAPLTETEWPEAPGIVLIVPGRFHQYEAKRISKDLRRYQWVLMIVTSDEERLFPWWDVQHERMLTWVQTPKHPKDAEAANKFGYGAPPGTRDTLSYMLNFPERPWSVFFSGQVTHERRQQMVEAIRPDIGRYFNQTPGFTQGLHKGAYLETMNKSKVALAPSGPQTVDSFRAWEAMEAGAVPIVDGRTPTEDQRTYWDGINQLPNERLPFHVVDDWEDGEAHIESALKAWQQQANICGSWLGRTKRAFTHRLHEDIETLGASRPLAMFPDDDITVLIPSSYCQSHPNSEMLWKTISSVRRYLPTAEILIMMDGNSGHEDYLEYQRSVLNAVKYGWGSFNISVKVFTDGYHQSGMTRWAMANFVKTPYVLFVEHDTPLTVAPGKGINFASMLDVMKYGQLDYLRFHYQTQIHPLHEHLMDGTMEYAGERVMMTHQWSQRPHLAPSDFYRRMLEDYFGADERMFIEERMHSEATRTPKSFRMAIYYPEGDIERSYHLDGRKS
jgi:hypothetical protein